MHRTTRGIRTTVMAASSRRGPVRQGLIVLMLLAAGVSAAPASGRSRALTREGYLAAYELNLRGSASIFEEARRADPLDPAPARALAAITWMEILFAQGAATFDAFTGEASADRVDRPVVDPGLTTRFLESIADAITRAEQQLAATPADADALYQLGASMGLLALYRATVEGRTWAAFVEGRRAVRLMERVRQQDGRHREAALILGMYRYAVSTLPWPKRVLAGAAGMQGDRAGGIALLEDAAAPAAETASDAALLLVIVYNREGRREEAMRHLRRLREKHPGNRLLTLNAASTALAACDAAAAAEIITAGLATEPRFDQPRVPGERAMWHYIRGAARTALPDHSGDDEDLRAALASDPRDWIRARTHLELAKQALRSGEEGQARLELEAAERYGRRAGDDATVEASAQLWRARASARHTPRGAHSRGGTSICDRPGPVQRELDDPWSLDAAGSRGGGAAGGGRPVTPVRVTAGRAGGDRRHR